VAFVVSPGQRHECRYAEALLDRGAVKRRGRGRPRLRPERVAGTRATAIPASAGRSASAASAPSSPPGRTSGRNPHFDRAAYRTRERVERLINRLKQFRRVATRYEKRGHHYLAFVTLAAIILWLPI
jgi:transposase